MQYNKVEISGINTAELKLLTEDETKDLLRRTKEGDEQAREKLIQGNFRLVLSVLQKFIGRGESADDLFQVGGIGLIKAIDNFNIELNVKFSTYGVPMILGEVRRYLRDNQSVRVSRSMRDMAYKAMQAKEKLTAQIRCEPTVEQIAAEIGAKRSYSAGVDNRPRIAIRADIFRFRRHAVRYGSDKRPHRQQRRA